MSLLKTETAILSTLKNAPSLVADVVAAFFRSWRMILVGVLTFIVTGYRHYCDVARIPMSRAWSSWCAMKVLASQVLHSTTMQILNSCRKPTRRSEPR